VKRSELKKEKVLERLGRSRSVNNDSGLFRDKLLCSKSKVSMLKHGLRKVPHSGDGLRVEISEHGIGLPATDKFDRIVIDLAAKEGGGAAGAE
jgi:hypothetical protein